MIKQFDEEIELKIFIKHGGTSYVCETLNKFHMCPSLWLTYFRN